MITNTYTLLNTVQKLYPVVTFIHDRYFPNGQSYYSEEALIETKKQGRRVAPFVIPQVNGIVMESEGYRQERVKAPYIAPKMPITAEEISKKAFGESPESQRTPAERATQVELDHLDELRNSVLRRQEVMDAELLTTGQIVMNHYASAEDAANGKNAKQMVLRFYEHEFKNRYRFTSDFAGLDASGRILEFYKMANILNERSVKAADIVMTSDVAALLMTDIDFLEFFNKQRALTGQISPVQTPAGVTNLGVININGIDMNLFSYAQEYLDLDGSLKPIFPKGTILMLSPNLGSTAYAQVSYVVGKEFQTFAGPFIPRAVADENANVLEVQAFSRPVPYPLDWDGWLVANIYDKVSTQDEADNSVDTDEPKTEGATLKTEAEIKAMTKKADVIAYAKSIGLDGLDESYKLNDLIAATLEYQSSKYGA